MPPPSTSLADSVLFWCVCVGALTSAAAWFATRAWFRRALAEQRTTMQQTIDVVQQTLGLEQESAARARELANESFARVSEVQEKLQAFESARIVGPVELEALIVRRWLRNAGEHANPSPQKAISSAAAVALAFVGADHLRARVEPLTAAARKIESEQALGRDVGLELTHPDTQASLQWLQVLSELDALLAPDAARGLLDEWLWGKYSAGEYWNTRALRMSAGEVLTQGHMAAVEVARKRANGSADLAVSTVPPDPGPAQP